MSVSAEQISDAHAKKNMCAYHDQGCAGGPDGIEMVDDSQLGKGYLVPEPYGPVSSARDVRTNTRPLHINYLPFKRPSTQEIHERGKSQCKAAYKSMKALTSVRHFCCNRGNA